MSKVVTFYSYKGGVGRTMALVNVAHALARDGFRVLMIDLDLEAPGMTHFFADAVREHAAAGGRDAVDFLLHVKRTGEERTKRRKQAFVATSLAGYVVSIPLPNDWTATKAETSPYLVGRLDLLPATADPSSTSEFATSEGTRPPGDDTRDYLARLALLDLPGVFSEGGLGHRFGDEVRRYLDDVRFDAPGDLVYTLREPVKAAYDVVLVDSRTGLNEISGLCIGPLCDVLVVCTGLNDQNVEGTRYFMRQAGLFDKGLAKPYVVVVGPVPPWTRARTDERLKKIRDVLQVGTIGARVPYHPEAAIREPIFVIDDPDEAISRAYEGLAEEIVRVSGVREVRWPPEDVSLAEAATTLAKVRLQPDEFAETSLAAGLPSFEALRSISRSGRFPHVLEQLGVAIAAYRLRSAMPFARVLSRHKLPTPELAPLLFLRLRLVGTIPLDLEDSDRWVKKTLRDRGLDSDEWGALAIDYMHGLGKDLVPLELIERASHYPLKSLVGRARWFSMGDVPEEVFAFGLEKMGSHIFEPTLPDDVKRRMASAFVDTEEMLKTLTSTRERLARRRPWRAGEVLYVPMIVSSVALVKGRTAVDEIVGWLALCRRMYGYGWRVLVDWRHLAEIRDEPAFIRFLKEEDDAVSAIERAIDSGEYPL